MENVGKMSWYLAGLIVTHWMWRWTLYPSLKRMVIQGLRRVSTRGLQAFESQSHQHLNQQTLLEILQANASTQYGQKYNFLAITSAQEFRETVPLIQYDDIRDAILSWCHGEDPNLLSADRLFFVATSSGTTGHPKWIPVTQGAMARMQAVVGAARGVTERILQHPERRNRLRKVLVVSYHPPVSQKTNTGIFVGPLSQARGSMPWWLTLVAEFCSPPEVMPSWTNQVLHFESNLLLHILFSILTPELEHMTVLFGSILHHFFFLLEQYFLVLARVIRTGQSRRCDLFVQYIPSALLDRIDDHVTSTQSLGWRQDRADWMEHVKDFAGIVPRLWPGLEYVTSSVTGAFRVYEGNIRHYLGSVPLLGAVYMSSEAPMGLQYNRRGQYAFHPQGAFFEFIPEPLISHAHPSTLLLEELKPNERYEVVLTTSSGLYRYRLGDVIQVDELVEREGMPPFPLFTVLYRTGSILDAYGEKTTESHVERAILQAGEVMGLQLEDFTTCLRTEASPVFYQLFVEWKNYDVKLVNPEELIQSLDEALQRIHPSYQQARGLGKLNRLHVIPVAVGSFHDFRPLLTARGTAPVQVKIPRLLKDPHHPDFFLARQIEC